jgi:hypothetical protein
MRVNRIVFALVACAAALSAGAASAGDHIVAVDAAHERLAAARAARAADEAVVFSVLARPEAAAAASAAGVPIDEVRARVGTLSDAELADLAARAAAMTDDPVAGAIKRDHLIIGAIALAALIVILIVV